MIFYYLLVLINLKSFAFYIYLILIIMRKNIFNKITWSFSRSKPILYIFAGQGTQQQGMLNKLLQINQAKQQILKLSNIANIDFIKLNQKQSQKQRNKTKLTQPLLVLSQVLHFKYFNKKDLIQDDFMMGHSIGEYSALCIAKSINLPECLKLVSKRGELMQQHTKQESGMIIIRFSDENKTKVYQAIKKFNLQIACYNTPNNITVAGVMTQIKKIKELFKQLKITNIILSVSAAFHCSMLESMKKPYSQYLNNLHFQKPKAKIIRNLDCKIYENDKDIRQGLIQQLTNPVQFEQSIKKIQPQIECIQIGHKQFVKKYVDQTRKKAKAK